MEQIFDVACLIVLFKYHADFIQYNFIQMKQLSLQGNNNLKDPTIKF